MGTRGRTWRLVASVVVAVLAAGTGISTGAPAGAATASFTAHVGLQANLLVGQDASFNFEIFNNSSASEGALKILPGDVHFNPVCPADKTSLPCTAADTDVLTLGTFAEGTTADACSGQTFVLVPYDSSGEMVLAGPNITIPGTSGLSARCELTVAAHVAHVPHNSTSFSTPSSVLGTTTTSHLTYTSKIATLSSVSRTFAQVKTTLPTTVVRSGQPVTVNVAVTGAVGLTTAFVKGYSDAPCTTPAVASSVSLSPAGTGTVTFPTVPRGTISFTTSYATDRDNMARESTCGAAGSVLNSIVLPTAPTAVSGVAGDASATLAWTAPADVGGSAVMSYRVTPYVGATAQAVRTFTGAATTGRVVTGLTNDTAYTFKVAAVTAAGTGPLSTASAPLTPRAPWYPFTSWGAFVDRTYHDLLGRAPTPAERSSRITLLTNHTLTAGGMVAELRFDADHTGRVDPVTRLYRAYFLRIPDAGGLTFWIGKRRAGTSLDAISQSFAASSEFKTRYGSLSNAAFVALVYQNVLGRPGEAGGVQFWTTQLDQHKRTRGGVMAGFSESNEYKTAQQAEVDVSVITILLLGRAPTAGEFGTAVGQLEAGTTTPAAFAQSIIASTEYASRIRG